MGEASVADVVGPAVLWDNVGEVQVSVQGLGHSFVQRQLLEVWSKCGKKKPATREKKANIKLDFVG